MFTGIIQGVGTVRALRAGRQGARLSVAASAALLDGLKPGDSIAVSGCCLTLTEVEVRPSPRVSSFSADLAAETLRRTAFRRLRRTAQVNLELPLRVGDLLSGHLVQGHVDGTGTLIAVQRVNQRDASAGWWMRVRLPEELLRYVVWKGSLAVEGISLTVAELMGDVAGFAVIPFTYSHTNLVSLRPGVPVNLEADLIARHVERLLAPIPMTRPAKPTALRIATLREQGL